MSRYMVAVDHDAEMAACTRAVEVFQSTGSHYLTHADWGCLDGVHTAWIIVEADTREEARSVVPPGLRDRARVVALTGFAPGHLEELLARHRPGAAGGADVGRS